MRIGPRHFAELFGRFEQELSASNISRPSRCLEYSASLQAYATLFRSPELLPPSLTNALLAIEEFATPENQPLLRMVAAAAGIHFGMEDPEAWAIQLWLRAPFDLRYIATLKSHIRSIPASDDDPGLDPSPDQENAAAVPAESANGHLPPAELSLCPRNKIARLPQEIRESIDQMLGQALTYAEILERLGEMGKTLNKSNLWRWKKGPHQRWLKDQQRFDENRSQLQFALRAVQQNQNNQIHEATQQIAALRISELFTQFDLATLKQAVSDDPQTLVRLAHLLPKLSQGGLECERQRVDLAERQAALSKSKRPKKRGVSPQLLKLVEQELRLM